MNLKTPLSLSELWNTLKDNDSVNNYERFIRVLDMLYIFNLVELKEDKIRRINHIVNFKQGMKLDLKYYFI